MVAASKVAVGVCALFAGASAGPSSGLRGNAQLQVLQGTLSSSAAKVEGELSKAMGMMEKELKGHPDILKKEETLIKGAEQAAEHLRVNAAKPPVAAAVPVAAAAVAEKSSKVETAHAVDDTKVKAQLTNAESMIKDMLKDHPKELKQEEEFMKAAEVAAARVEGDHKARQVIEATKTKEAKPSLVAAAQKTETATASSLVEAEEMIKNALKNHPKELNAAEGNMKKAEAAAAVVAGAQADSKAVMEKMEKLVVPKKKASLVAATQNTESSIMEAEEMIKNALKDHPKELNAAEGSMKKAEAAAALVAGAQADAKAVMEKMEKIVPTKKASLVAATQKTETATESMEGIETSLQALQEQRSQSTLKALKVEQKFATAEDQLAQHGSKIVSEFSDIKKALAKAMAGKDETAVETAMNVGELLDQARDKQKDTMALNKKEAAVAKAKVAVLEQEAAKNDAMSKAKQEERAYTSGMATLATDDKATLASFSGLDKMISEAFAGQNSAGVQKAMQVGELLNDARIAQSEVTDQDQKDLKEAPQMFHKIEAMVQHSKTSHKHALVQKRGGAHREGMKASAQQKMRLQRLMTGERHVLSETASAEGAIEKELAAEGAKSKDGGKAAAAAERDVIAALEQAKKAELRSFDATRQEVKILAKHH